MMEPESPGAEKGPRGFVIGEDGDLDGRVLDAVVDVGTSERLRGRRGVGAGGSHRPSRRQRPGGAHRQGTRSPPGPQAAGT